MLGAVDYLLGNRFGIGSQFERGICCTGKLIIAMTGFMSLAPILGRFLTPLVSPFFTALTADPSAFAAMLLPLAVSVVWLCFAVGFWCVIGKNKR